MKRILELDLRPGLVLFALANFLCPLSNAAAASAGQYLNEPGAWFQTAEARRIADNILTWQAPVGDWPKNGDTVSRPYAGDKSKLHGTFDNGATTGEIRFLARAYTATKDVRYQTAALKGIDHLLKAQYPTGGWPQYSPPPANSYHRYITFNDNAMVRVLETLRKVATSAEFDFVDQPRRGAAQMAFDRGIACILRCQIKVNGQLTVWCAQHDEKDLSPRPARKFELVSLSGAESAGILHLLMTLDPPSPGQMRAIQAGAGWFAGAKITGIRQTRVERDKVIVADTNAPALWARFYDLQTGRPLFSGRDSVPKYTLAEIEAERRNGYAWYGPWGESVATDYAAWSKKWLKPPSNTP
jgi:PelA/Pel-15E family pectate lyase